jgi:DNA-binding transcriptional regulator PaaX
MPKKDSTLVNALLFSVYAAGGLLSMLMVSPHQRARRLLHRQKYRAYSNDRANKNTVYNLRKRGLVEVVTKDGQKFLKLTERGELEVLLAKARIPFKIKWDGKWRVIIFDIPEDAKLQRNQFRDLLKKNNFKKLQASVYISPFPFNREAVSYLQQTGLIKFIRMLKVEELDNDRDLRKKFNL